MVYITDDSIQSKNKKMINMEGKTQKHDEQNDRGVLPLLLELVILSE